MFVYITQASRTSRLITSNYVTTVAPFHSFRPSFVTSTNRDPPNSSPLEKFGGRSEQTMDDADVSRAPNPAGRLHFNIIFQCAGRPNRSKSGRI